MSPSTEPLQGGLEALQAGRYREAIDLLEIFCQLCSDPHSKEYLQAQMGLAKAFQRSGQPARALSICLHLAQSDNPQVRDWAEQAAKSLQAKSGATSPGDAGDSPLSGSPEPAVPKKAGRALKFGAKLPMASVAGNLALASGVTLSLLFGMVLVLFLAVTLIINSDSPVIGFVLGLVITVCFNALMFFLSPLIMDVMQGWLYKTRWVSITDIQRQSPEAARVIQRICADKKIKQPRLGVIDDQNPTAFTYGALPNDARLVVSQGLFTYLDDDEIATVYAHELGHIVHWDFAVMTLASTLVQITYLIYIFTREVGKVGDKKVRDAMQAAAIAAYVFYLVGTYLVLYLSRTREYFADHFAAEVTGNPNGLSRALVKIAYGLVEEGKRSDEPSRLVEGTRALGIYDHKSATMVGTAYRIAADPKKIGRVFLWDFCNPWGWWMELSSTHPLTGKRVRALTTYAEHMGLETEFDMAQVIKESKGLSKQKLYGGFFLDLLVSKADWIAVILAIVIAFTLSATNPAFTPFAFSLVLLAYGLASLGKMFVMYPDFNRAEATDILSLMSDPYASPLRGKAVKLEGDLIGRGDAGYVAGSDMKLQDKSGMIYLHYSSRFGPLGNLLFGFKQVQQLIGSNVTATGWFRRGIAPWVDLTQLRGKGVSVDSYHRFWQMILSGLAIVLAFALPMFFMSVG